jgi:hypothetical protein
MNLNRNFPYVVVCYIIVVGLFFIIFDMWGAAFISTMPPGKYYLYGFSIVFIVAGIGAVFLMHQGKLKKSVKEVRLEAIENFKDTELLANIALEDKDVEIQKAAEERLKEIGN